jgi:hypothetical protein
LQPWFAVAALVALADRALDPTHLVGGDSKSAIMAHLVDKEFVERANTMLLLGILWGALAACVIAAMAYDIAYWFEGW